MDGVKGVSLFFGHLAVKADSQHAVAPQAVEGPVRAAGLAAVRAAAAPARGRVDPLTLTGDVVGGAGTVDYIVSRSAATGEEYLPEQVHAVVETQLAYLRAIGAVGDAAGPDGPGAPPDPRS